jgi:hypothetical protein
MRYSLLSFALAALATANPLERRQTSAGGLSNLLLDVTDLARDMGKMSAQISKPYTSDGLNAFYGLAGTCAFDSGNVTASLGNSGKFNQADSVKLGAALLSTLNPAVTSMASNLVAHKASFQAASATAQASVILHYVSVDAMSIASVVAGQVSGPTAVPEAAAQSSALASAFSSAWAVWGN